MRKDMQSGFNKLEIAIDAVENTVIEHHGKLEKRVEALEDHTGIHRN